MNVLVDGNGRGTDHFEDGLACAQPVVWVAVVKSIFGLPACECYVDDLM